MTLAKSPERTVHVAGVGGHGVRAQAGSLAPGGVVGDGRYRLLAQFGADSRVNAVLWRARDGQLSRDVALTILIGNPADAAAAGDARRVLDRATHAAQFHDACVARVLDVLTLGHGIAPSEGILGIVVAEWTPGTDLLDLVADGPVAPSTATALVETLASAVEQAHHSGLVLGIDHPQRLRLTPDGVLRLAFPGPTPHGTLRDDVRGLGALLYLLLTGRWALPGGPEALPAAPTGPDGAIVAPRILQPDTPQELSSLATRCLEASAAGGIRTSAAVLQVLDRVSSGDPDTTVIAKVSAEEEASREEPDNAVWTTKKPVRDPRRQKRLALSVGALVVATVAVAVWIVTQVVGFFFGGSDASNARPEVVATSSPTPSQPAAPPPPTTTQPPPPPLGPATINVFVVEGTTDYPERADDAIDGDPGTEWKTVNYFQNFPTLIPGEGLMATFDKPTRFREVDITSHYPGTVVEIRSSATPDPTSIDDTRLVGGPATLVDGLTRIQLNQQQAAPYMLVWITHLAEQNGEHRSGISEITYLPHR